MYQSMLFAHWKQARFALLLLLVASFGLPLLSVQGLGGALGTSWEVYQAISASEVWLPMYPALSAAIGATLALTAWSWDHQLKHVYALALPLRRWEYVLLKMGAGIVLALVPAFAFWMGAHVAARSITLPVGLNAYPNELALRFLLGILVSYAAMFAAGAGTVRTTLIILTGSIGLLIALGILGDMVVAVFTGLEQIDLGAWLTNTMVKGPGPFAVFTGNWSLIDV